MTVVVTGAAGHVGGNLVRALLEQKQHVRVLVHQDARALAGLEVERVEGDVLDPQSLQRLVQGAELVYHLAAVISISGDPGGEMRRVNVEGTRNVARACIEAGVGRMVHFSSIHAFSHRPDELPIDERRGPPAPDAMPYDLSKAAGEREVQAAVLRGLDAVIVNPTAVVGPHDYRPSHMGQVLVDLHRGTFPALVDGGFDWVDVRDVVQAAIQAARLGRRGERYLLGGTWATFGELARLVHEATGARVPSLTAPMWLAHIGAPFMVAFNRLRGTRPLYTNSSLQALRHHRWISCDKARQALDHIPRPLGETVRDTLAWFDGAGMLDRR